ncbi:Uncharacterized membrane protein YoaK, UPF0700 family [Loktanella fryxellensis]|uniref:Uncharacterized membrane protein YoaK, UPF0700 family n=1 Tax=Loktanella fryxellensis TaxID=245187 RepID=A0A1H8AH76_9RHOB|nr:YoaK family protein [Loktanella fryxellensis]SEM70125.1 Uncharacterized membrane protein YoaK, UPF0700 family [Loktanella fryxellensis]
MDPHGAAQFGTVAAHAPMMRAKVVRRVLRPVRSARVLLAPRRTSGSDRVLGTLLAAIAGAANAGGFFAVGQYTSHMTGYLSLVADNVATLQWRIVLLSTLAIVALVAGAATCTLLITWARRVSHWHQYAWPLCAQGVLLGSFALGAVLDGPAWRIAALVLLCFIMGMQNAMITKISGARIRTTHATGMVTDIGIEVGRAVHARIWRDGTVMPDRMKLAILLQLVTAFVVGGVAGAVGYGLVGFLFSLPLAAILLILGLWGSTGRTGLRP